MARSSTKQQQEVVAEVNLFDYIQEVRKDNKQEHDLLHKRISNMKDELLKEIKEMREDQTEINKRMDDRVSQLEKWKWTVIGGAIVIGFVLAGGLQMISTVLQTN
jgi:hypothetical protein